MNRAFFTRKAVNLDELKSRTEQEGIKAILQSKRL